MNAADYSDFCQGLIKPIPVESEEPPPPPRPRRPLPPAEERRMVKLDGDEGELCTGPLESGSSDDAFNDVLEFFKLDPAVWEVADESVRRSSWEQRTSDGEVTVLTSYRARIQRRRQGGPDVEALMAEIRDHAPHAPAPGGEMAFVVAPADLQLGKGDVAVLVDRFMAATDAAIARLAELRDSGHKVGSIYILHGGDCLENTQGHYPGQAFQVTLGLTEQMRVYRRLMLHQVKAFAPLADRLVLASCNGNHGEIRNGSGKAFTKPSDNYDTEIATQVADILAENPDAYGHVSVAVPVGERLDVTLDIAGTRTCLTHGHQFRGSDGAMSWWAKQAHGLQPAGEATLLFSGHKHHLRIVQEGQKTHIQLPALDTEGSTWWVNATGQESQTGMVSVLVGSGAWSNLAIH